MSEEINDLEAIARLAEVFDTAKPEKSGFEDLPDGEYVMKVDDTRLGPSDKGPSGARLQFRMQFEVLAPETIADANRKIHKTKGRKTSAFFTLIDKDGNKNERNTDAVLWTVNELGLAIGGAGAGRALATRHPELRGSVAIVKVKRNKAGTYTNVDVLRRAKPEEVPGLALAASLANQAGGGAASGTHAEGVVPLAEAEHGGEVDF